MLWIICTLIKIINDKYIMSGFYDNVQPKLSNIFLNIC